MEGREYLVKFTFPELRHWCRERLVVFVEVDLRWGSTGGGDRFLSRCGGKSSAICIPDKRIRY